MLNSLTSASPMFSEMGEANSIAGSAIGGFAGVVMLVLAIYSFIVAYGFGKYKNYARIMVLIPLYIFGIICNSRSNSINCSFIYCACCRINIFNSVCFLWVYSFLINIPIPESKDMVALFKGQ